GDQTPLPCVPRRAPAPLYRDRNSRGSGRVGGGWRLSAPIAEPSQRRPSPKRLPPPDRTSSAAARRSDTYRSRLRGSPIRRASGAPADQSGTLDAPGNVPAFASDVARNAHRG